MNAFLAYMYFIGSPFGIQIKFLIGVAIFLKGAGGIIEPEMKNFLSHVQLEWLYIHS